MQLDNEKLILQDMLDASIAHQALKAIDPTVSVVAFLGSAIELSNDYDRIGPAKMARYTRCCADMAEDEDTRNFYVQIAKAWEETDEHEARNDSAGLHLMFAVDETTVRNLRRGLKKLTRKRFGSNEATRMMASQALSEINANTPN